MRRLSVSEVPGALRVCADAIEGIEDHEQIKAALAELTVALLAIEKSDGSSFFTTHEVYLISQGQPHPVRRKHRSEEI